jgi:hypothetical protein
LKFLDELWAGRACAGTNQQELTTCAKSGGQQKKKYKKKGAGRPLDRVGLVFLFFEFFLNFYASS